MLAYFPTLYVDELLYSGIARYHVNSGNASQKQTIKDLFDDRLVCSTTDLPSSLGILAENLNQRYMTEQLIQEHTLFPYYTSYVNREKMNCVKLLMGKGSTQGEIHAALGLLATNIKLPRYLKYCSVCYNNEMKNSEPYWHRSHQLPGVHLCPLHKVPLLESNIACSTQNQKFSFESLAMQNDVQHRELFFDGNWMEHLKYIAEQSYVLLKTSIGSKKYTVHYKELLLENGYMTVGGTIRFDRFIQDFRAFFTDELLKYLYCDIDVNSCDTWLHKIIRNNTEITHPLRHLLLLRFFDKSVDSVVITSKIHPFGHGPWPCLNKAANHYYEDVVTKLVITGGYKSYKLVGTFECSCGFIYSRSGTDKYAGDKYRIGRIKVFGLVWYDKLKELNESQLSLRQKARLLGVDPGTVKNQTFLLGKIQIKSSSDKIHKEITFRREKILKTVEEVRTTGVLIRQLNTTDYNWLCRHDQLGLKKQLEIDTHKKIGIVDWNQRDQVILYEVKRAIQVIKHTTTPQRITLAAIMRNLDIRNVTFRIDKCLNKLPKSKEYLDEAIESTEQFQIRRLYWSANVLRSNELIIMKWKLLKMAGLNLPLHEQVKKELYNIILTFR